ncbi:DHA2 family efflux MFS transporter permease subunit [Actinomadura graeca]|uniref:DHA2 family efflux MFS transporter permease subunit n=1 Tax=Actinomadura graeca TaxID=2750812 RepID=A0ABX8QQK8_9ACTN|nr:DHA2 family efflux MFS transporter permease subunit [Actinomadura graeca]QXJ20032.1 DHA2 family efflux MFS transporter permease subunit [Actinomadura graeca]
MDAEDRIDGPLARLIGVMMLGGFMALLDATIVNVGIGTLAAHFGAPLDTVEWTASAYMLTLAAAIPVSGWAVDRYGGRAVWLAGLALFTAGSLLCALAWDAGALIAFRVVQGLGGGLMEPTLLTVLARAAGPRRAGRTMALMSVPMTLGPILGPVAGGLINEYLPWRWMFLVNLPVGALAIALAVRSVPRGAPDGTARRPLDVLGLLLLSPGCVAVMYGLSQAATAGFGAPRVVAGIALGAALVLAYVVHALRPRVAPLVDLRLLSIRPYAASVAVMTLVGGVLFALLFLIPLYYQQVQGHGVLSAGLLLVPQGVGAFFGMPIAGRLSDRVGARALVPAGGAIVVLTTLAYTQAGTDTSPLWLGACSVLCGLGLGFIGAPTMASVYRSVPAESTSSATGTLYVLNQIGAALGITVVTLLLQDRVSDGASRAEAFGTAFWWMVLAAAVLVVAAFSLPGRPDRGAAIGSAVAEEPARDSAVS